MLSILSFAYGYDIFNLSFSSWEMEGYAFPNYTFYSSVFNYAAGSYGGVVGGNYKVYGFRVKFFTSGDMVLANESGDSLGTFSSNFISFDGSYSFPFKNLNLKVGPSLRYASLGPQVRGVALALIFSAERKFEKEWGYFLPYATLDGLGYEILPTGLKREALPFRAYAGGKVKYSNLVAQLQGEYYAIGGADFSLSSGLEYDLLSLRIGYSSHYSALYGGYGKDRIAGMYFSVGLKYRKLTFDYTYNPLGIFGDRHVIGLAYDL